MVTPFLPWTALGAAAQMARSNDGTTGTTTLWNRVMGTSFRTLKIEMES